MGHRSELLRKKDNCIACGEFKPIKAKCMCQNCWHKHKRKYDLNFFLRTRYTEIKQRAGIDYRYENVLLLFSRQEFLDCYLNNETLKLLYKTWQENNFEYTLAPSIDRIDVKLHYSLDNIQWITHGQNSRKDQVLRPVVVHTVDGTFIGKFDCLNDAVRFCGVHQANAHKVVSGKRNHTKGFIFKDA